MSSEFDQSSDGSRALEEGRLVRQGEEAEGGKECEWMGRREGEAIERRRPWARVGTG